MSDQCPKCMAALERAEKAERERDEARRIATELRDVLNYCTQGYVDSQFYDDVTELGERVGYGVLISCAARAWAQRAGGGDFTKGPPWAMVRDALAKVPKEWDEVSEDA